MSRKKVIPSQILKILHSSPKPSIRACFSFSQIHSPFFQPSIRAYLSCVKDSSPKPHYMCENGIRSYGSRMGIGALHNGNRRSRKRSRSWSYGLWLFILSSLLQENPSYFEFRRYFLNQLHSLFFLIIL